MIDPKELRIGNLVGYKTSMFNNNIFPVDGIGPDKVHIGFPGNHARWMEPEAIDPIALNEDWLRGFGFAEKSIVKNGLSLRVLEGYVFLCYLFGSLPLCLSIDGHRMPLHQVKYIHQLQNLHFDLTGQELMIAPRANGLEMTHGIIDELT